MRVTNKMLANSYLSDMNTNLEHMKTIQKQMATGKNFSKPSDDPFNVARSMQMNTQINANTQYNKNITNTINWLDTTDTALGQLNNVFQSVREKMVAAGNAAYGSDDRQKIKDELNQRVGQMAQILNTSFDGEYIFAGTKGASKPVNSVTDTSIINVVNPSTGGNITISGSFSGSNNLNYKIEVAGVDTSTPPKVTKINVSQSTDGGITFGSASSVDIGSDGRFAIGNNLFANIADDTNNNVAASGSNTYTFGCTTTGNTRLMYCKEDGTELDPSVDTTEFGMIKSSRQTEISQGVLVKYNVSAADVMSYTKKDGTSTDIRSLMQKIVNHLDGKDDTGASVSSDSAQTLISNDLSEIDDAMGQILKVRSQVGSMQNRMDSAKDQNEQSNTDMTEILSKTEDVDITEKTMDYATMQTVYLASLQTSAKVLQPTLMDYMS
ncbi:flagellar hook-associated protein FlgL [Clostridium thailandense]|uniref:flagellar hook-associated protein FlgL n=1 Tax=Clostridium thailandense TaxID=2794346 RepID=UPI00398902C4